MHTNTPGVLFLLVAACDLHRFDELVPPTVDEDHSLSSVEVNGTRLHVETYGADGDPVIVFLHGGPGDDFRYLLPLRDRVDDYALEDDHLLVFFDQRGGGLSRRHDDSRELTLDLWIEDLAAVVDTYAGDAPVTLIGHSGGGLLATGYIDRYPERVRGAVLLEPSPMTGALAEELATTTSLPLDPAAEWVNDWTWGRGIVTAGDHARIDYSMTQAAAVALEGRHSLGPVPTWRHGGACKIAMSLGEMARYTYDFTGDRLDTWDGPALFVVGELTEDLGEPFQAREQMGFFRDATLEVIPASGHNDIVYWNADDSLRHIHPFVRSLP